MGWSPICIDEWYTYTEKCVYDYIIIIWMSNTYMNILCYHIFFVEGCIHNMYRDKHTHIFYSLRIFLIGYSRNEYFFRENRGWGDKRTELEGDFLLCAWNYFLNFVQFTWFKYSENKCKLVRGQWVWKDWERAAKEVRWKQGLFSKPKEMGCLKRVVSFM